MWQTLQRVTRWLAALLVLAAGVLVGSILWGAYVLPPRQQVGPTLTALYADDQAARRAGFADIGSFINLTVGDWQRLQKVRRMVEADMLTTGEEHYHAAIILHHGNEPADFLLAQRLAQQAAALGDSRGHKLHALAEDRYLVSLGQPQRYGSQYHCATGEGWQLQPVEPGVTDVQRQAAGLPALAEQQARVARIQQLTQGQCALTSEMMQQLQTLMEP